MEDNLTKKVSLIVAGAGVIFLYIMIDYTNVVATTAMIKPPIVDPPFEEQAEKRDENGAVEIEATPMHSNLPVMRKLRFFQCLKPIHHYQEGRTTLRRGIPLYVLYWYLHGFIIDAISPLFLQLYVVHLLSPHILSIFASLVLSRLHMAWIHVMIATPQGRTILSPGHRLRVAYAVPAGKALLLPTLVYTLATRAIYAILQLLVENVQTSDFISPSGDINFARAAKYLPTLSLVASSALAIVLFFVLPSSIALTRIETAFLPEDDRMIVAFDRAALLSEIDPSLWGGAATLFLRAWRSVDRKTTIRLVGVYANILAFYFVILMIQGCLMLAVLIAVAGTKPIALLIEDGVKYAITAGRS